MTMIDSDTRDYFFDLLKTASPRSNEYILRSLYGYLEGLSYSEPDHFEYLLSKIQIHTDCDHGIG